MAQITINVAGRGYVLACRDGEEDHLQRVAAMIDRKCSEATSALGVMPEPRLLLTAALLIADELTELRAAENTPVDDHRQLESIAQRIESLCAALEQHVPTA